MKKRIYGLLFLCSYLAGCAGSNRTCGQEVFVGQITSSDREVIYYVKGVEKPFKVMFLSDTHFTVEDERGKPYYQYSKRMGGAAVEPENYGISNGREKYLAASLERAEKDSAKLVILGGDIINFPSEASVEFLMKMLKSSKLNWRYISGNHDWHYEGEPGTASEQRTKWEQTVLKPLYQGENPLYYSVQLHGIDFVFIDNSTNEVTEEQLDFLQRETEKGLPILLSMHIPVYLPGHSVGYGCGHPDWNQAHDHAYKAERRQPWPESGHTETTFAFCKLVKESPMVIGIFTGHTHQFMIDYYKNKIQCVNGANFQGKDIIISFLPANP